MCEAGRPFQAVPTCFLSGTIQSNHFSFPVNAGNVKVLDGLRRPSCKKRIKVQHVDERVSLYSSCKALPASGV